MQHVKVRRLNGVVVATPRGYLVGGEETDELEKLIRDLAAEGKPPREVWLTHHHRDHQGGVGPLAARGLPVYAHALTLGTGRPLNQLDPGMPPLVLPHDRGLGPEMLGGGFGLAVADRDQRGQEL